jgi:HEAT repeat protein
MAERSDGSARLATHRLMSSVQRKLEQVAKYAAARIGERAPLRWQQITRAGGRALHEVAWRWPQLAALLGLARATGTERAEVSPARVGEDESTADLIAALRDQSSEVAVRAAETLRRHGGEASVGALREVLANDDRYFASETRVAAIRALGAMLPLGQGTPLHAAVSDADATVSLAAIAALSERDEPPGADALLGVIERTDGFYLSVTRQAAARALSGMHGHDATRLRALLDREGDPEVRTALASLTLAS